MFDDHTCDDDSTLVEVVEQILLIHFELYRFPYLMIISLK